MGIGGPDFSQMNTNSVFGSTDAWAPGAQGFGSAIKYWQSLLNQNAAGNGLQKLAVGRAQSGAGSAYQAQPYDPSQGSGIGAYEGLKGGEASARSTGRNVGNQVQQASLQGATDVASKYGDSLINHIQGTIAQNAAESAANAQMVQGITNMVMHGAETAIDASGSGGGGGSAKGPFSAMTGNQSTYPGFTNAAPNSFSSGSLPPWLDPNTIAQYGPLIA